MKNQPKPEISTPSLAVALAQSWSALFHRSKAGLRNQLSGMKQPSKWHSINVLDPDSIPPVSAVYAIYRCGRLVYIGESGNVRRRMMHYCFSDNKRGPGVRTKWGVFRSVKVKAKFPLSESGRLMLERKLILRLKPVLNRQYAPENKTHHRHLGWEEFWKAVTQ